MEPIGRSMTVTAAGITPRPVRAAPSGFALPSEHAPAAIGAAVPLGMLLAMQESAAEPPEDRAARRRGRALLAELAALQHDLLADAVSGERLDRLRSLAADPPLAAHPTLREALDAVVLRARIELARFGAT